jgi:hypothetical protein
MDQTFPDSLMAKHFQLDLRSFLLGGHCVATVKSEKTGKHFTYRVKLPKKQGAALAFVEVNCGDQAGYKYIGSIFPEGFRHSPKSPIREDAPSVKGFNWLWRCTYKPELMEQAEIMHSGVCCRCGRELTDPTSIALGVGPICANKGN